MSNVKLLPCPFCGADAAENAEKMRGEWRFFMVACGGEGCGVAPMVSESSRELAIAAWNTRAAHPAAPPEVMELVEALKQIIAVSSGERQVADNDTEGMEWINKSARAALAAYREATR